MSKSPEAFRTISEIAEELELPQHVLRFWETKFTQIKPMKRGGGRRFYRPEDVDLVRGIKGLLYDEGYTIRGVQRLLKQYGNRVAIEYGKGTLQDLDSLKTGDQQPPEGSKSALDVATVTAHSKENVGGLLGRLTGRVEKSSNTANSPPIANDDLDRLQSTLHELLECKRLLEQTRQD